MMENIHGIDVSWLHNTHSKDNHRQSKKQNPVGSSNEHGSTPQAQTTSTLTDDHLNGTAHLEKEPVATPRPIPQRPGFSRSNSSEKTVTLGNSPKSGPPSPASMSRRNSWLSSISSKFSSSPVAQASPSATNGTPLPVVDETSSPYLVTRSAPRNAVLQHGVKEGSEPYIPAPPKSGQASFLQSALRRFSSSSGQVSSGSKGPQHGLCERMTLNVDHARERCRIPELDLAKLRRVAFCVDVEIASGPKYKDDEIEERKKPQKEKKALVEKGEGLALKHPQEAVKDKEESHVSKTVIEDVPKTSEKANPLLEPKPDKTADVKPFDSTEKDTSKKKEKKKRSEEERKARKEKKRRDAEESGTLPVELVRNASDSSSGTASPSGSPKITQAAPTTDPVRIYRRCCQLRDTPILKKITEQLAASSNCVVDRPGIVSKLDLHGAWLKLEDLVTLGDYLAVVPVKELNMENCGLTDEGLRVILAGLLAAKSPELLHRNKKGIKNQIVQYGGVVERLILKHNSQIGRDGWRYISLFIHMSRSLKFLDLSMVPFPQATVLQQGLHLKRTTSTSSMVESDAAGLLSRAIGERLGGNALELLNMSETGINTEQLGALIDGVCKSGLRRLGLAGNHITAEGMEHVLRYLRAGKCEGLDLGSNSMSDYLPWIAEALDEDHPLWALSLADCDLTPDSLWKLFPALVKLKNLRFIDVSHNHELFNSSPSALPLLRRYLPKMPILKRIHLTDVSMTPEQAIALAEVLPDSPSLAHINLMENPQLTQLASATDEANQEEACALYASLMAAVRVSKTIICIDIDVPEPESSEIVKALAKQVVAYCLRNMERDPVTEITEAAAANSDLHGGEREIAVPDVLLHIVGHIEGSSENHDNDEPAPDQDYVIGGTGVVKALGICLSNRGNDSRRPPGDRANSGMSDGGSGVNTPRPVSGGKAKDMSKNLLGSARKIRGRLQPALIKEAGGSDRNKYNKLLFLDQTLERMIERFENEYPETRLHTTTPTPSVPILDPSKSSPSESDSNLSHSLEGDIERSSHGDPSLSDDEDGIQSSTLSRQQSEVSLASRVLSQEEGRMHRFGQKFRRDILKPEMEDHVHGTTGNVAWAPHFEMLRAQIEELGGEEIKRKVEEGGEEAVIRELTEEASVLRRKIIESDPEAWEKFRHSQEVAQRNSAVHNAEISGLEMGIGGSPVE